MNETIMKTDVSPRLNKKPTLKSLLVGIACSLSLSVSTDALAQYFHTEGTKIVDAAGEETFFNGVNLGNWLLWEGYLMMGDFTYRTHSQFLGSLTEAFGSAELAAEFEHQWRLNYVDEQAIIDLANLGFDSVRVPFHYNMFWKNGQLSDHGFQYFDRLIGWCRDNNISVLLDMHAAPGYQNPGDHSDNVDSNTKQPRTTVGFWDGDNVEIASNIWRHIADRYKDEPVVWGYDLINEPVTQEFPASRQYELLGSMVTMRNAIREVDNNHIIVAEGGWWSSNLYDLDWTVEEVAAASGVTSKWDDNLVYQLHHYGPLADTLLREEIAYDLDIPVIIGEYGETDEANLLAMTQWAKDKLSGYYPWSFKKMSHDKTLWTIPPNDDYEDLKAFINGGGTAPAGLYDAMISFAQNNIGNGHDSHIWHQGFYDAISPFGPTVLSCDEPIITIAVPGKVQAESFCEQSGVETEITEDVGGGQNIGFIGAGDRVEYSIDLESSGTYAFLARIAAESEAGSFSVSIDGVQVTTVDYPVTYGWQSFYTAGVNGISLDAGEHIVRIDFENAGVNVNWFEIFDGTFVADDLPKDPSNTCDVFNLNVPGLVEAEDFCLMSGIEAEPTGDVGGGENIGYIDAGDWVQYAVNIDESGDYTLRARVAAESSAGTFNVSVDGVQVTSVDVPVTDGWQTYETVTAGASLSAGPHIVRFDFVDSGMNINWVDFVAGRDDDDDNNTDPCLLSVQQLPAQIEAEDFCDMDGIRTQPTTDNGGGENIGWIDAGDWAEYGISVDTSAQFVVNARVASNIGGGRLELIVDGVNLGGFDVSSTGGWQNWQTLSMPVSLTDGDHVLRVEFPSRGLNVNWIDFAPVIDDDDDDPVGDLEEGTYRIISETSGKALDVSGVSTSNGANVQQWTSNGGANQQWIARQVTGTTFELVSVNSGACLDADSGSDNVHQWQCFGNDNQRWNINLQSDGSYTVRSVNGNQGLEVQGGSANNGANVRTASPNTNASQKWRFNLVN